MPSIRHALLLLAAGGLLAAATACAPDPGTAPPPDEHLEDLSPAQGFDFRIPPFQVAAGTEDQDCFFVQVPDIGANPIWVNKIKIGVNAGSHHFSVFRVRTIVGLDGAPGTEVRNGECFKSSNWADWPLVVNTQNSNPADPYYEFDLPAGVDHKFLPGEKLMLQVHYVNASTQKTPQRAKVDINFYKSSDTNPMALGTLFATQQSIRVCASNPNPTYSGTCSFGANAVHIAAANGHFHSRGRKFDMFAWNGVDTTTPPDYEKFYESLSWDDPPMVTGLNVMPPAGGGVWWNCTYQWEPPPEGCDALNAADPQHANDCCYTFGPHVDTNEHCNAFIYYWPAVVATSGIFCN